MARAAVGGGDDRLARGAALIRMRVRAWRGLRGASPAWAALLLALAFLAACVAQTPGSAVLPTVLTQGVTEVDHPRFQGDVCVSRCGVEVVPPEHFGWSSGALFVYDRCDGHDVEHRLGTRRVVAAARVTSGAMFLSLPDSTSRYLLIVHTAGRRPDPRLADGGWTAGFALTLRDSGAAVAHLGEELYDRANSQAAVREWARRAGTRCALLKSERR